MNRLFKYPYPKLTLLGIIIVACYLIFQNPTIYNFVETTSGKNIFLSALIAGFMFSFGFTTPISISLFLIMPKTNIPLIIIMGGIGSMLSDIFIFQLIRNTFEDEIEKIENTKTMKEIEKDIFIHIKRNILKYLTYLIAGIIIASPLPDEVGVSMLSGFTKMRPFIFAIISFLLHALGLYLLLLL